MTERNEDPSSETTQPIDGVSNVAIAYSPELPTLTHFHGNMWTGVANWYREHIHEMSPQILTRHQVDLEGQMANHESTLKPLSDSDRMEIAEAIAAIDSRLDEILPKVPAAIDEHDKNSGNRVHLNWPDHAQSSSRYIHLHFCELIDAWRIQPARRSTALIAIDQVAETNGQSGFAFDNEQDLIDFVEHYKLGNFVVATRSFQAATEYDHTKTSYYLTLSNKFTPQQANIFLDVYKSAINKLAAIADARRRAVNVDGGRIGFLTVDYFCAQEQAELSRIAVARYELGMGNLGAESDR